MAYSQFHDGFWTDPEIRELCSDDKLLLAWFITNPNRHYSGIYFFELDSVPKQVGLTEKIVRKGIDTLSGLGFIKYNPKFSMVWVIKMARHEVRRGEKTGLFSEKQTKGIANHFETLHKCPLIKDFLTFYSELEIPYQYPIVQEEEEVKEEVKEKEEAKAPGGTPPPKKVIKKIKTTIPENFTISDAVRIWAQEKGFDCLEEHLEAFKDAAASRGYEYLDWDSAFRRAIREDWGKIRANGSGKLASGGCSQPGIASWLARENAKEALGEPER